MATRSVLIGIALALLLAAPAPAADPVTQTDPAGDSRGRGLDRSERRALDVVSVTAMGERESGLLVTVTFAGNHQREMGRDDLARGGAALVLRPNPDSGAQPTVLLSQGAGAAGQTYESGSSDGVGVLRARRELTFFVAGGIEDVESLEVKTFARLPRAGAGASAARPLSESVRDLVLQSRDASDIETIITDVVDGASFGARSCPELQRLLDRLNGRSRRLERLLEYGETLRTRLDEAIEENTPGALRRAANAAAGWLYGIPEDHFSSLRALRLLRQQVDQEMRRLATTKETVDGLATTVARVLRRKYAAGECDPPLPTNTTVDTTGTLQGLPPPPGGSQGGGAPPSSGSGPF